MDQVDLHILECLKTNARMKASDISKQVNLSVSSVIDRIHKLENSGVIVQYTTVLDRRKIGNDILVIVGITLERQNMAHVFEEQIQDEPAIVDCYAVAGDCDFLLHLAVSSHEELYEVHQKILNMDGVAQVKSFYVIETVKQEGRFRKEKERD
jgi:Lrp/AsnC family leucine-responsive transcriptional regulator